MCGNPFCSTEYILSFSPVAHMYQINHAEMPLSHTVPMLQSMQNNLEFKTSHVVSVQAHSSLCSRWCLSKFSAKQPATKKRYEMTADLRRFLFVCFLLPLHGTISNEVSFAGVSTTKKTRFLNCEARHLHSYRR